MLELSQLWRKETVSALFFFFCVFVSDSLNQSVSVRDLNELERWISRWAWAQRESRESHNSAQDPAKSQESIIELFRYKGVISVRNHPNLFVLQVFKSHVTLYLRKHNCIIREFTNCLRYNQLRNSGVRERGR